MRRSRFYGRADHRGAARGRRRSFNGRSVPSPWDLTRDLLQLEGAIGRRRDKGKCRACARARLAPARHQFANDALTSSATRGSDV